MQVGIVAQRNNPRAVSLAGEIRDRLPGHRVVVDETTAEVMAEVAGSVPVEGMADCGLVVSIGGDGTFLYAARGAGTAPIVGVNLGEVGFLNAVAPEDAAEAVAEAVADIEADGHTETRSVDRVRAVGDGWALPPAINEISVHGSRRGHGHGVDLTVRVDGTTYLDGHADGVLVATPTGSTAYNLSEGGPLVHPDVQGLVVTEMAGTDGRPPLVVDERRTVEIEATGTPEAVVVSDGRIRETVETPATVRVEGAGEPVNIAGPELDFFAGLEKLE